MVPSDKDINTSKFDFVVHHIAPVVLLKADKRSFRSSKHSCQSF